MWFGSIIRPFFIVAMSKRLRVLFACIFKSLPFMGEVSTACSHKQVLMELQVLILMALVVLLFDWVGMLLFEDWGCGSTHGHSPASAAT